MSSKGREEYLKFLNSVEWKEQRAEALDRSSGFCEYCGEVAINVHHVEYPKKYNENNPHNLVSVCKKCHELSHGIRNMEKIIDAKIMTDLAPNGISMKYLLTEGRIYASAKSWIHALQVPGTLKTWFETGLARTAMLKEKQFDTKLEMEFRNTPVYRWHVVAELLRSFDRQWYKDQYRTKSRLEQKNIKTFHENYERIVSWGYDLQERALNSLINPTLDNSAPLTPEDLHQAVKQVVSPRFKDNEKKINEHDIIISEIKNVVPVLRDMEEFITVKQAINEQGLDSTSMPFYPNSKENLSGLVGQILKEKSIKQGEKITSRIDGQSITMEVNTYHRGEVYEVLESIAKAPKQTSLF